MQFERKTGGDFVTAGANKVTITEVKSQKSKSGFLMLVLKLNNKMVYLTDNKMKNNQGISYFDNNLNNLLNSIADNGYDIPNLNYGINKETADFLQGKQAYALFEETEETFTAKNGQTYNNLDFKYFLSKFKYDKLMEEKNSAIPEMKQEEFEVLDDDLPF